MYTLRWTNRKANDARKALEDLRALPTTSELPRGVICDEVVLNHKAGPC